MTQRTLLTINETMRRLGVSRSTLLRLRADRDATRFPLEVHLPVGVGRSLVRIDADELDEWIEANRQSL